MLTTIHTYEHFVIQSFYFSPVESFDDPFEDAKGVLERESKWNDYYLEFFRYAIYRWLLAKMLFTD